MRPVDKSLFKGNKNRYNLYGDAKDDLILAIGDFCSYCERQGYSSALDVEHINDKHTHPKQKYLKSPLKEKAQKLLDLVGLDRVPGNSKYSFKDKRWEDRKKVWEIANRYLNKYKKCSCDIEIIMDLALAHGFWSIWMTTFQDYRVVQEALIKSFSGAKKYN
jgi:hypothetical protein